MLFPGIKGFHGLLQWPQRRAGPSGPASFQGERLHVYSALHSFTEHRVPRPLERVWKHLSLPQPLNRRSLPSLRTMPGSSLVWSFHSLQLHTISVCFLTGLTQEAVSFMKAEHMGLFYHCVHTCTHIVTAHSGCSAIIDSVMKFYEFISHSNPFKSANWERAHPSWILNGKDGLARNSKEDS